MPHDKKGQLLQVGDVVTLSGTITAITSDQPTYCNITFMPHEGMAPMVDPLPMALSARMVDKVKTYDGLTLEGSGHASGIVDVPATDPAGYMASGKREPTATALTPGEAARIEFGAGRNIAREGRELPNHASDAARNGFQYEQALMQARGSDDAS